jgi:hypothetical protein
MNPKFFASICINIWLTLNRQFIKFLMFYLTSISLGNEHHLINIT